MEIIGLSEIRGVLRYRDVIDRMRVALMAYSRGECETPMPMHLDIALENAAVHMKSSYRRGGAYFALKIASSFPNNTARGFSTSNGMVLLSSAATGDPVAFLADSGFLTDVRTAAAAAMVARELGRTDRVLGILGTGVQARLQARLHAEVLPLERVVLWGRTAEHAEECARDMRDELNGVVIEVAASPGEVALAARLIITATASRQALLRADAIQPGTHISAVGADSPGKQELDPETLRRADLLLVDSLEQCVALGELQHAPDQRGRAVEIGMWLTQTRFGAASVSVCDFTGLGVEDLYIAEYCYENRSV